MRPFPSSPHNSNTDRLELTNEFSDEFSDELSDDGWRAMATMAKTDGDDGDGEDGDDGDGWSARSARKDGTGEEEGADGIGRDRKGSRGMQVPRQAARTTKDAGARRTNTVVFDPRDGEWRLLDEVEAERMLVET